MPFEKRTPVDDITERINGCANAVRMCLGCGFPEKLYENALVHELRKAGLAVRQQVTYRVVYDAAPIGEYVADLVVEDLVVVEVKACAGLAASHRAQCISYLKASGISLALLINFGLPRVEIRRIVRNNQSASRAAILQGQMPITPPH